MQPQPFLGEEYETLLRVISDLINSGEEIVTI